MKKISLLLIGILFLSCNTLKAQYTSEIEMEKRLGVVFLKDGNKLTPKQLLELTKDVPDAYYEMKIAKSNYDVGSVFGFAGGFLIGWPLGTAMGGGEANWTLAGIGAGLVLVSVPFSIAYSKHAKKAVENYNNSLKQSSQRKVSFNFGHTKTGIGITMNF